MRIRQTTRPIRFDDLHRVSIVGAVLIRRPGPAR